MKRWMAAVLACLVLAGALASCAANNQDDIVTTAPADTTSAAADVTTEPETPQIPDNLPEENYDGYTFRMFLRPGYYGDMWREAETGEMLNDAVYARNRAVCERFNVEMEAIFSADNNGTDCLPTILAGDDAYDLLAPHGRSAFTLILQNVALDWDRLTCINVEQPWWDQDARRNFTIKGKLYTMNGDISYLNLGYSFCMVFNKNLFDDNGLEYPYELVREGKWTWDEWEKILAVGDSDLNGDGKLDFENDRFAYLTHEWYGCVEFMYPAGIRACTNNAEGVPEISIMSEKTVEVFQRYFSHITKGQNVVKAIEEFSAFAEGRVFTIDCTVQGASGNLREMEDEFGIIPWPKYSEEDEYAACINAAASLLVVPITIEDPARTSVIIEGMAAESYRNLIDVYYDVILQTKTSRDRDSAEMLDVIRASRVFDFGYYNSSLGDAIASLGVTLYNSYGNANSISSFYAKASKQAEKNLQTLVEKFETLGDEQ